MLTSPQFHALSSQGNEKILVYKWHGCGCMLPAPTHPALCLSAAAAYLQAWTLAARLWSYLRTKMHCTMYISALVFTFRQSPLPPWLSIFL